MVRLGIDQHRDARALPWISRMPSLPTVSDVEAERLAIGTRAASRSLTAKLGMIGHRGRWPSGSIIVLAFCIGCLPWFCPCWEHAAVSLARPTGHRSSLAARLPISVVAACRTTDADRLAPAARRPGSDQPSMGTRTGSSSRAPIPTVSDAVARRARGMAKAASEPTATTAAPTMMATCRPSTNVWGL